MVRLTLDKAYTVHARSTDRIGDNDTPSAYRLALTDPITCPNDTYMKCTLINAKIPSTFYQIDSRNRTLKVVLNDFTDDTPFTHTMLPFAEPASNVGSPLQRNGVTLLKRKDYLRVIEVSLDVGNYTIEDLLTHIEDRLNTASTAAHASEAFRTFLRPDGADILTDLGDAGLTASSPNVEGLHVLGKPSESIVYIIYGIGK